MSKYSKLDFEKHAMFCLERCFDGSWIDFDYTKERPDLQNEKMSIGIEVTRVLREKEGQAQSIWNQCADMDLSAQEKVAEINRRNAKANVSGIAKTIDNSASVLWDLDLNKRLEEVKKRVIEKTQKLNNGYKIFKQNYLFIFCETSLFEDEELIGTLREIQMPSEMTIRFHAYFLETYDFLYVFWTETNTWKKIRICDEIQEKIKQDVLRQS